MTAAQKEAAVLVRVQKDNIQYYFADMENIDANRYRNINRVHILAMCTALLLEEREGLRSQSSRDSWGNKRIEASSKDMEYLLKNAKMAYIAKNCRDVSDLTIKKIADTLEKPIITDSFISSFCTQRIGRL